MKTVFTPRFIISMLIIFSCMGAIHAQFVGIGTAAPESKLHIAANTAAILRLENTSTLGANIPTDLYFKTGAYYTGAVKTIGNGTNIARLSFLTYASANAGALLERMSIMDNGFVGIGTTSPTALLDVNGRIRVRNNGSTASILFSDLAGTSNKGIVGMENDNFIGFSNSNGSIWGLTMNVNTGDVYIDSKLTLQNSDYVAAEFETFSTDDNATAVQAIADFSGGHGIGVDASGGSYGVKATAGKSGNGHRYGVDAFGANGTNNNYGVYAFGAGGNNAYGIYATATSGTTNWAGYFSGSVYTTGTYQGSDRKLKDNIQPLHNAVQLIQALKPSTYEYKTATFQQLQLPEGEQFGLIADEVKQVFPSMVKRAVQPAKYENDDSTNGRMIADEVSFEAVNYTAMIPVLIAAMQEQQTMIDAQQKKIEALEARLK